MNNLIPFTSHRDSSAGRHTSPLRLRFKTLSCALVATGLFGCALMQEAKCETTKPFLAQIEALLKGVPISQASPKALLKAVRKVIEDNPNMAQVITASVLSVDRPDMWEIDGPLVGTAIEAEGSHPSAASVIGLVQVGVDMQPSAVLSVASSASAASPCEYQEVIVQAAAQSAGRAAARNGGMAVSSSGGAARDGKQIVLRDGKESMPSDGKRVILPATRYQEAPKTASTGVPAAPLSQSQSELLASISKAVAEANPDCRQPTVALREVEEARLLTAATTAFSNGLENINTPITTPDAPLSPAGGSPLNQPLAQVLNPNNPNSPVVPPPVNPPDSSR